MMRRIIILILALALLGCVGQVKIDVNEILKKSEESVLTKNLDANATFEMLCKTPKLTDFTRYDLRIVKIGNTTKIFFLGYEYNTTDKSQADVHKKTEIALKDAWILDRGDVYYVYTPNLLYMKDRVGEYRAAEGLPRYKFIPIMTCLDLARFFDKAEDPTLEVGDEAYVVSYKLSYPTISFAEKADVKVWISKKDHIPFKAEISAKFDQTEITMKTELKSYKTEGVQCDMSLKGLSIVKRY